jgi:DNA polymerase III delta prime subunit
MREILGSLKKIVDEEKVQITQRALLSITQESEGSLRDAQSLLADILKPEERGRVMGYFQTFNLIAVGLVLGGLFLITIALLSSNAFPEERCKQWAGKVVFDSGDGPGEIGMVDVQIRAVQR